MPTEHRTEERWPQDLLDAYLDAMPPLKPSVVLSGGWAWHFICPQGHVEYRDTHDHSCLDIMAPPRTRTTTLATLTDGGFKDVGPSPNTGARRYEKLVVNGATNIKVTINLFIKNVPLSQTPSGWLVVRPDILLEHPTQGGTIRAAGRILDMGIDPGVLIGHPDLSVAPSAPRIRTGGILGNMQHLRSP